MPLSVGVKVRQGSVRAALIRAGLAVAMLGTVICPIRAPAARAFDVCDEVPADFSELFSITSPAPGPLGFGGPPPLTLTIQIHEGLAVFEAGNLSSFFEWGDGSSTPVAALSCANGTDAYWPNQSLSHTYQSPGQYRTIWHISAVGQQFALPFIVVVVTEATALTPEPATPTPTQAPAAQPTPVPPAAAGATEAPVAATSSPNATTATLTPTPTASPTSTATPTPLAAATPAPTTGTPTGDGRSSEPVATAVANQEYRSRTFLSLEEIDEVSREPDVLATNLVIAGVTVWVLFSSVLLNQVLQDNRAEVDRKTSRLSQPVRRLRGLRSPRVSQGLPGWARRLVIPGLVLAMTGLMYSVLEPGFGFNEHTVVLFGSAVLGVGLVTYLCAGLEALATRRWVGAAAAVRPFPACIAIAAASVAISRLLDMQPGVMYGFVASCAVAAPVAATSGQGGRVALAPVTAALAIAVGAWLLVGPIRELNEDPGGWLPALLEATVIVVFIGGIEGTVVSMLPLQGTDGGKIYRWHRGLWLAIALAAAFLTWHVLLGRERSYFGGLRQAASMAVLAVFIVYTALTAALWAYFRFRKPSIGEATAGPSTAG